MADEKKIEDFFDPGAPENSRGQLVNLQNDGEPDESFWRRLFNSIIFKAEPSHRAKQKQGAETNAETVGHVQIHTDAQAKAYESGLDVTPTKETTRVVHASQLPESNENPELITLPGVENNDDAPESETQTIEVTVDPTQPLRNNFLFRIHPGFFSWLSNIVTNINLLNTTIFGPGGPNNPGGGGIPGGSGSEYINPDSMPETVGGWDAGSSFPTAKTMQEMWDGLLYPFQVPVIALNYPALFTNIFEVGEALPLSNTVPYSVSNFGNIQAPADGALFTDTVAFVFPINPITLVASGGSFDLNFSSAFSLNAPGSKLVTLTGLDTQAGVPVGTGTINWKHKRYWGTHPSATLPSNAQILAANGATVGAGNEFADNISKNYAGIDGGGTGHLFFAWPANFANSATPTFTVNGLGNTAFIQVGSNVAFTNLSGHVEPYNVFVSTTVYGQAAQFTIS